MSTARGNNAGNSGTRYGSRQRRVRTSHDAPWTRPSGWIAPADVSPFTSKFSGTYTVTNDTNNLVALTFTVTNGYTVDWGDGNTEIFTSSATAYHNYVYSNVSSTTQLSNGDRQAVITVTPTSSGNDFSFIQCAVQHTAVGTTGTTNAFQEIVVAATTTAACNMSFGGVNTVGTVSGFNKARSIKILSVYLTTAAYMFQGCTILQEATIENCVTTALTSTSSMFYGCSSLRSVPYIDTSSVTAASNMFSSCSSLESVPAYNWKNNTTFSGMFNSCSKLFFIPDIDSSGATASNAFSSMFNSCYSLRIAPKIVTKSTNTNFADFFRSCFSLDDASRVDMSASTAITTFSTALFSNYNLKVFPPGISLSTVTSASSAFSYCTNLPNITIAFNSTTTLTAVGTFAGCKNMTEIPAIDANGATDIGFLSAIGSATGTTVLPLKKQNIKNNKSSLSFQNTFLDSTQLNNFYTDCATLNPSVTSASGNGTTITYTVGAAASRAFFATRTVTITGMNPTAYNLTGATVASVNWTTGTFTVTNAATGTFVSGGTATITSNVTITVTDCPGNAADDPTIATAKGWTVTG